MYLRTARTGTGRTGTARTGTGQITHWERTGRTGTARTGTDHEPNRCEPQPTTNGCECNRTAGFMHILKFYTYSFLLRFSKERAVHVASGDSPGCAQLNPPASDP